MNRCMYIWLFVGLLAVQGSIRAESITVRISSEKRKKTWFQKNAEWVIPAGFAAAGVALKAAHDSLGTTIPVNNQRQRQSSWAKDMYRIARDQ